MTDRAPDTLPSTITCRGYVLSKRRAEVWLFEYRNDAVPFFLLFALGIFPCDPSSWLGCSDETGTVTGATWQEVVRKLEQRPLSERVGAALLRAWRWVKEVVGG